MEKQYQGSVTFGRITQQLGLSATAGAVSTFITNPIDVIKVRLQLQVQQKSNETAAHSTNATSSASFVRNGSSTVSASPRIGMLQLLVSMVRIEGLSSLWSGISPALFRVGTYSAVRVGFYEPVRTFLTSNVQNTNQQSASPGDTRFSIKVMSGLISGSFGAIVGNPFELVKVRMQGNNYAYRGTIHAVRSIVEREGFRALWNGLGACMVRASLLTASQMATYDEAKSIVADWLNKPRSDLLVHTVSAMLAGLVTTTVTSPADVVKTRIMNEKRGTHKSSLHCLVSITKNERWTVLFQGWTPNYIRLGPQTLIFLVVYDKLRSTAGFNQI